MQILKKCLNVLLDVLLRVVYVFRDLGLAVWKGLISIKNSAVKFGKRFKDGSLGTKLSHIFMGAGNFAHKQYVKGAIFLLLEIIFIWFMVASPSSEQLYNTPFGGEAIVNFFELGEYHGMPIDDKYDFNSHYEQLYGKLDLSIESGRGYVNKVVRIQNIFDGLDRETLTLTDIEEQEELIYDESIYSHFIKDNRYGTNDLYAYDETTVAEAADGLKVSVGSFVWIVSDRELQFDDVKNQIEIYGPQKDRVTGKDVLDENGKVVLEKKNGIINVYKLKDDTTYEYLVINQTTGNTVMKFKNINPTAKLIRIDYDYDYVNLDVDHSFLMLLFGVATFAIIAIFLIVYNLAIASSYKADLDERQGLKPTNFLEDLKSLLDSRFHITMLVPAIIFLAVFTIVPTILMILIAFTDLNTLSGTAGTALIRWTGFENIVSLFSASSSAGNSIALEVGRNFGAVLTWTFEWALIATFSCYFGGIFLAILINKKEVKAKKLWRTIFILTIAIPQFISLLVLKNLLDTKGPINGMLQALNIIPEGQGINFLQFGVGKTSNMADVWLARGSVLLINLYIGIPYTMLMTSGILMNIPKDLYEAATIDGANKWQMFRKITLPYIIFVTTPYLISSFIGNITSFNTIFLTTGGGPGIPGSIKAGHTDLLVTWLFKLTMEDSQYNAGSIIGILTFMITAFITLVCYRNSKAYKEEDTFQ